MVSVTKCGYVSIVGRPNVGKSTLLNHLVEQKISITSRKPQTTRNNVTGIRTEDGVQMIFVDTPGIHKGQQKAINRYMNKSASSAIKDVDVVVFVVDSVRWTDEDDWVLEQVRRVDCPVILAVNKIDKLTDKSALLPLLQALSEKLSNADLVPLSALNGNNLEQLLKLVVGYLPENAFFYSEDQITDKSSRFLASEIIREKITRQLGEELPYQVAVAIEKFEHTGNLITIHGLILVERGGQKRIIIGEKGDRIKNIGQQARIDMEKLFDCKVMLNLWVKIKSGWSDDDRALRTLGYNDF